MNVSLKSIELIHVVDTKGFEYFGCNQEWFDRFWRRLSGCGPSVASTLLIYLQRAGRINFPINGYDQTDCKRLMDEVWTFVTPTFRGVNKSEIFCEGIRGFAAKHQFEIDCQVFPIAEDRTERQALDDAVRFIREGLESDCPIAFLNLHQGKVKNLESWHWVSIVSLERDGLSGDFKVTIFDGDKSEIIDFTKWYQTTFKGGALVYLTSG